jgi:ribosomal protein S4E
MKTQIVRGWTNGNEEYRVYVNQEKAAQFKTEEEAKNYVSKLKIEKASIADDEQQLNS